MSYRGMFVTRLRSMYYLEFSTKQAILTLLRLDAFCLTSSVAEHRYLGMGAREHSFAETDMCGCSRGRREKWIKTRITSLLNG